ncbi:aldehyde dehydrogenase (NADP(+)) [Sphingomonas sp. AX6]|uniref:aldehyde dehydrogenase (NADP(+)) n=1 Tax=Sphingomonas sp. AX6 TaxID=2653171 RepID=UPI0012F43511|nr:aldehyde dehydrogenase (NADP(+)) [Sphingomonas sp. AX6]VXC78893.1 Alpha-ketoglutaric semialdehyde dehydrogenase 3 [Sphingomonas sp. AX6]
MTPSGALFIGRDRPRTDQLFQAVDPATGEMLEPPFSAAGQDHVERACALAADAARDYAATDRGTRAAFLESIADNIMALGEVLLDRAHRESGLPLARLTGERGRTVGQLRLFAAEVRDGGWLGIRIDPALPERQPLPRPDLRLRKVPVGPVAVFGASNFPLAFSVAGGDTASALAAGCPVVVKGHPAHPGTSEMIASAIADAIATAGLPEGVFSLLNGVSNDLGAALVGDRRIAAVGFTGSRGGGLALMRLAAERSVPIPVYAEMSAINPVVLLPAALDARAEALGAGYVASLTMGAGQFCTNPGLVIAIDSPALDRFVDAARGALGEAPASVMLTPGIHQAYGRGVDRLAGHPRVSTLSRGQAGDGPNRGQAAMFAISAEDFDGDADVAEEVFGASSVLVRCRDTQALARVIAGLEGQLTATLHLDDEDLSMAADLLPMLEAKAGRILANGWPTGVEVAHAMVHGGPYPATSDGRSTSVGTLAIDRFLRPVCYQDLPDALLPPELRQGGQSGLPHRMDGTHTL